MTKKEFATGAGLVMEKAAVSLGFARPTLAKLVDVGALKKVKPPGCAHAHYAKVQLADLMGWPDVVESIRERFRAEPHMMGRKEVLYWTGMCKDTLNNISAKGGLRAERPLGASQAKYRKWEVAKLLGLEDCV